MGSATLHKLVIIVPTTLPCTPSHQANVPVLRSASAIGQQMLRVGAPRTLTVGSAVCAHEFRGYQLHRAVAGQRALRVND